jgi:hypothetical protein
MGEGVTNHWSPKWYFVILRQWFHDLPPNFRLCSLWTDGLTMTFSTKISQVWIEKTRQILCYSHGMITESSFEYFMRFKHNLTQIRPSFASSVTKSRIALNRHKNRSQITSKPEGCGCITQWTDSEGSDIMAASGRNLYYLRSRSYRKVLNL